MLTLLYPVLELSKHDGCVGILSSEFENLRMGRARADEEQSEALPDQLKVNSDNSWSRSDISQTSSLPLAHGLHSPP